MSAVHRDTGSIDYLEGFPCGGQHSLYAANIVHLFIPSLSLLLPPFRYTRPAAHAKGGCSTSPTKYMLKQCESQRIQQANPRKIPSEEQPFLSILLTMIQKNEDLQQLAQRTGMELSAVDSANFFERGTPFFYSSSHGSPAASSRTTTENLAHALNELVLGDAISYHNTDTRCWRKMQHNGSVVQCTLGIQFAVFQNHENVRPTAAPSLLGD